MQLCLLLVAFFMFANANPDWKQFKTIHGKTYSSKAEESLRKELYLKADAQIKKHNSENHPWKMKHTVFSDMTTEERNKYNGFRHPQNFTKSNFKPEPVQGDNSLQLPSKLDYRNDECMAPIKDQGGCGSCWLFSAMNPIEFAHCRKHQRNLTVLSEQHLVDCVYKDYGLTGCWGGWMSFAYNYLLNARPQGVAADSSYPVPYQAQSSGSCQYTEDMQGATLAKYQEIVDGTPKDVARSMMKALVKNSTIAVAFYVPPEFYSYGSGVFFNTTDCDKPVTHAVTVVGYGRLKKNDYWIVRNSWGVGWGDNGYVLMRRGVNQCRIESVVSWVSVV